MNNIPNLPVVPKTMSRFISCVLRWKDLFLFFSSLDTCGPHLPILESINAKVGERKNYEIVWIPVVEEWNGKEEKEFEELRSKMPWYTAKCSCLRKSDMKNPNVCDLWDYEDKPILVVINSYGDVKNANALPMFEEKGIAAFPFHTAGN
ncbi:unnamed protein product [Prunus brigantina]